jgi:spore coat polysaccharide biosynthesis predicted glycosyltransferase SpsG
MKKINYIFDKYDLTIIGEMTTLLSKKCEPEKCGKIIIENTNNKPGIKINWKDINNYMAKLTKYEKTLNKINKEVKQ